MQSAERADSGAIRVPASMRGAPGGSAIKKLSFVDNSDGGAGSVGDLLHSLGYQLRGSSQIQLQGLNQFLRFHNRGEIFREVCLHSLCAQTIVVLLEHMRRLEKLLERGLVQKGLTLRAGGSLGQANETLQPAGESGNPIVMQSINQTDLPRHTPKFALF